MAFNIFAQGEQKTDNLLQVKAGQMTMDATTKTVSASKRKGLIILKKGNDDLLHFMWKDRVTGQLEHDLILFPSDASFLPVKEAEGRVYVLKFNTSDRVLFFWLQELSTETDKETVEKIQQLLKDGPPPEEAPSGLAGLNGMDPALLAALAQRGGLDKKDLMAYLTRAGLGGASPPSSPSPAASPAPAPAPTPSTPAAGSSTPNAAANALSSTLSSFLTNFQQQQQQKASTGPSLSEVIDPAKLVDLGLFSQPSVVKALAEFLPEQEGNTEVTAANLEENVNSPQFKHAVATFNAALRSGQLNAVLQSFGLPPSSGSNELNSIEEFLNAIQKATKSEGEGEAKGEAEEKEDKMEE
eukprot:TRINITY_DN608_c0_g2_i1.p1 TRINITY_DN608_c0_g2~~TRINITY_DN608_c0_g2_i1.p1  ORF type:complete len:362 (+),score=127.85 TRINITY_DN608_c0_g2_i1:22-1086(+)